MKLRRKAKTTSPSNATTSPRSGSRLHANKNMLVDVDSLSVKFGSEKVLEAVSFCVHSGEFIGLIGPNGAGKTTLLRALLGLTMPAAGHISYAPHLVYGYVPQRGAMHDSQIPFSVLDVVRVGARGNTAKAMEALRTVDMANKAPARFATLSGGQQQKVYIAKALANSPTILVLDEPTTGIDERSQTAFFELLNELQKQTTIIMVSHDIDAVLRQVTRVVCLNRTILYDGPPAHFEADKYLPDFYRAQHRLLHHHHGDAVNA